MMLAFLRPVASMNEDHLIGVPGGVNLRFQITLAGPQSYAGSGHVFLKGTSQAM